MPVSQVPWIFVPGQGFQWNTAPSAPTYSQPTPSAPVQQPVREFIELPRGLITEEFSLADVGTSLTASTLYRIIAGSAGVVTAQIPIRPAFRGSVVGLALQGTTAKTAGTAVFTVYVKGAQGLSLIWETGASHAVTTIAPGTHAFAVGDDIDVRVTTDGSFAPTTADVELIVYLAQSSAGSET